MWVLRENWFPAAAGIVDGALSWRFRDQARESCARKKATKRNAAKRWTTLLSRSVNADPGPSSIDRASIALMATPLVGHMDPW